MGEYDFSVAYPGSLGYVERKVQKAVSHWKYNPRTHEYDVALLKFDKPVKFEANVIPICLPNDNEDLAGQTGWVTGWGKLYEGKDLLHSKPVLVMKTSILCAHILTGETCFNHRENRYRTTFIK